MRNMFHEQATKSSSSAEGDGFRRAWGTLAACMPVQAPLTTPPAHVTHLHHAHGLACLTSRAVFPVLSNEHWQAHSGVYSTGNLSLDFWTNTQRG
jgi:hypothetical protein